MIDISDPAAVGKTDNVPVGLAGIASLTTSVGYKMTSLYDSLMARPDSVTYSKTGMLFGSQIVAETSDLTTQNPELAQMLPDYVENCVIGDILLNAKYTVNQLLNSSDPLALITSNPSPLRGIFKTSSTTRQFITCQQATAEIKTLANVEANPGSATFTWLTQKIFGNKINGATLLSSAMGDSYGFFYAGGMTASQIMKNNITNSAIRQGIKGFAARSSDTANLLNLATENAATKQRLSWASGNELATRTLPFAQSLLMLILVCLFPLMIALAATNHGVFGLNTLKIYVSGFIYFQLWPIMFAILNYASNYWLQSQTGGTALVLSNKDIVALQHSDVANLAGYLSLSIPVLSFYLTRGAAAIGSQVAGGMLSSAAFTAAGVSSTTADGNWSFNNMSMDNVNQNKMDTNLVQRQGQQTWQADNGSTQTMTAGGHTVIDGSGAMSNLPVNMKLSQLASSGFQESARQSQVQAQTALDGYNHSVTSGWSQLSQLSNQTGTSDSLSSGSENSLATNATRGASMMMSAAESYAKANNISTQEAYNELMSKSVEGSVNAGVKGKFSTGDQAFGKIGKWATGVSIEAHGGAEVKGASGSSHGTQESSSNTQDLRHDKNSQAVNDFRQGMDMVTSSRVSDGSNHTENAATSNVQQFAATLNDAESKYHQYTSSSTQSDEFSRMATIAQNQSASLDTNYTQEFVNWAANKYGDKAQSMLTSAPSAREAAMEFVNERLKPEITGDYQQGRSDLVTGSEHEPFSGKHIVHPAQSNQQMTGTADTQGSGHYNTSESSEGVISASSGDSHLYGSNRLYGDQNMPLRQDTSARANESSLTDSGHSYSDGQTMRTAENHSGHTRNQYGGEEYRSAPVVNNHRGENHSVGSSEYASETEQVNKGINVTADRTAVGGRITGNDMSDSFKENQERLREQAGKTFEPQNDLKRRAAEQRSDNLHNINDSADEIDKKLSTVQTSSGILKDDQTNAQSKFASGFESENGNQKLFSQDANDDDIKTRLNELRRRAG